MPHLKCTVGQSHWLVSRALHLTMHCTLLPLVKIEYLTRFARGLFAHSHLMQKNDVKAPSVRKLRRNVDRDFCAVVTASEPREGFLGESDWKVAEGSHQL